MFKFGETTQRFFFKHVSTECSVIFSLNDKVQFYARQKEEREWERGGWGLVDAN